MTKQNVQFSSVMTAVLLILDLIWLRSSFGKVIGGEFAAGMSKSVGFFMSNNPYPFVKQFLLNTVMPNAVLFGNLTMWGEVLVALAIAGSLLYMLMTKKTTRMSLLVLIVGLIGGIFLNKIFWFSAGWTSPSTDSLNLLMCGIQLVGLVVAINTYRKL